MKNPDVRQLFKTEDEYLKKLHKIVLEAIDEEKLISEKLIDFEDLHPPFTSRLADRVSRFAGSWKFIIVFFIVLLAWMAMNVYFLSRAFDPYPFILLNLILSTIAAIQAPIIMMSQNRKEEKDRQRAVNDYLINMKAEIEIRNVHSKLDLLIAEQMQALFEIQKTQMKIMEDVRTSVRKLSAIRKKDKSI